MSKLLLDDNPLVILPQLAVEIGLNEAVFIQQLHYWVNGKSAKVIDGEKWVRNTYDDWQKQFPFWSTRTLRRIITSCENKGLIKSGNFNEQPFDKTKWYTINDCKALENAYHSGIHEPTDELINERRERACR